MHDIKCVLEGFNGFELKMNSGHITGDVCIKSQKEKEANDRQDAGVKTPVKWKGSEMTVDIFIIFNIKAILKITIMFLKIRCVGEWATHYQWYMNRIIVKNRH